MKTRLHNLFETRNDMKFWKILIKLKQLKSLIPAGNYTFKVNDRNTKTRYGICSQLTIKTTERRHKPLSNLGN